MNNELWEISPGLRGIFENSKIDENRFVGGISFVLSILEGSSRTEAYLDAFNSTMAEAKSGASQLYRTKWIQAIIAELETDVDLVEREAKGFVAQQMTDIMESDEAENSAKIAAAKTLLQATKTEQKKEQRSTVEDTVSQVLETIKALAENGKMISQTGEVIEVQLIE